ncbi:MAG TPA: diacylglycerol kinase family protein [Chthoniobacterales bacterium]|jgi:diacylglycerol kinase family enzyme|nr:diacylglycerol kinase family protein [Chthoniobacterales bacterium]
MLIALLHNSNAGRGRFDPSPFVRQLQDRGQQVLYVPVDKKGWEAVFGECIDRAVIAGGDGTVSRLVPWLAARKIPFCILASGTANNCAQALGQAKKNDVTLANLASAPTKKVDLGLIISEAGAQFFIESAGAGLLPLSMSEMRASAKNNQTKWRRDKKKKLNDAKRLLWAISRTAPEFRVEVLVDRETIAHDCLLLEITNTGSIGPGLHLAPKADAGDGFLDVVWVPAGKRKDWVNYLKSVLKGEELPAPAEVRRCRQITFRNSAVPFHVDGKVFDEIATPLVITLHPRALELVET